MAKPADIVAAVRAAARRGEIERAQHLARGYVEENGPQAEALEALSWLARAELKAGRSKEASDDARRVHRSIARRATELDSEPRLASALGASIEVLAQAMASRGRRADAVRFLDKEIATFGATSIRTRLRKNLNLLALEGQPAPELDIPEWIGKKPPALSELKGRPVLLFFWAHYCEDSRAEARVLARILSEFGKRGLVLMSPTRRYGYFDEHKQQPAAPQAELRHIKDVLQQHYADLAGMPIPLSESNFDTYGVSTTPTLTLVAPSGIVALYHPGKLAYRELAVRVRSLVG